MTMTIKDILIKKGWISQKVPYGRRMVTALKHPTQNIMYMVQAHEFRAGMRTIAKVSSRNVVHDEQHDLIVVDGFIAIKP